MAIVLGDSGTGGNRAEDNDMVKLPTLSRAGCFFQTVTFKHAEAVKDFAVRQEAIEHPTTNKWKIQQVWLRPNLLGSEPPLVEEYEDVLDQYKKPLMLSLADAVAHLATFEHANKRMGLQIEGPAAEQLGDTHVEAFAALNGFALDVVNKPHPTYRGHIVTKGFFAPETRVKVMDAYNREPASTPKTAESSLSQMFRSSAIVEDFSRLIERKVDLSKWGRFVKAMDSVVEKLCTVQSDEFKEGEKNASYSLGLMKVTVTRYEEDYKKAVQHARDMLAAVAFISPEDRKNKYERMLQEIQLVYEVAHAKALYARMNKSDEPEKHARELQEQAKKAAKFCLDMGGSERDVQHMNAEIIENAGMFYVESNENGRNKARHKVYRAFEDHGIRTHSRLYYMPEQVADILMTLDETTRELEAVVAAEKKRIQNTTPATETAAAGENKTAKTARPKPKAPSDW